MGLHGMSGDAWNRYSDKGKWYYEVLDLGFKYNLTDLAAAIGLHQLRRAEALRLRRAEIAAEYTRAFSGLDQCTPPVLAGYGTHAWHLYVLRLNSAALTHGRAEVIQALGERGIGTSVHFIPLHLHPVYQRTYGYRAGQFPNAEAVFEDAVSLPIYPSMTDEDVAGVIDAVRDTLRVMER
jgi:dTDP-4-amino-4,6-dideoxygalactose transaminase